MTTEFPPIALTRAGFLRDLPVLGKLLFAFGVVLTVCAALSAVVLWNLHTELHSLEAATDTDAMWALRDRLISGISTSFWVGMGSLAAGGIGIVLSSLFIRAVVVRPIAVARDLALRIASHDLSAEVSIGARDETGLLMEALARMQHALRETLIDVRRASDVIADSAVEVADGSMNLSARTEQTAANLEQTTATMDALTETVEGNAQAAKEARLLAVTASDAVGMGNSAVHKVVATMGGIHLASRKIAEIIAVIDGIAFQTNILALNAAVEAARAGDQGRGFAVVASEVRSLAGRSAAAAKEIRNLITESVAQVEAGSNQVDDAGGRMHAILESVEQVARFVSDIHVSTNAQQLSIVGLGQAIGHVDQMTQQNAALVEESAAAAASLKDQASRLAAIVGTFRL